MLVFSSKLDTTQQNQRTWYGTDNGMSISHQTVQFHHHVQLLWRHHYPGVAVSANHKRWLMTVFTKNNSSHSSVIQTKDSWFEQPWYKDKLETVTDYVQDKGNGHCAVSGMSAWELQFSMVTTLAIKTCQPYLNCLWLSSNAYCTCAYTVWNLQSGNCK